MQFKMNGAYKNHRVKVGVRTGDVSHDTSPATLLTEWARTDSSSASLRQKQSNVNSTRRELLVFLVSLIVVYYFLNFCFSKCSCLLQFRQADGRQCAPTQWVFRPGTIRDDCGKYSSICYVPPILGLKVNSMKSSGFFLFVSQHATLYIPLTVAFNPLLRCCSYMRFFPYKF